MTKRKSQLTTEPKPSPAEITADQAWQAAGTRRRVEREQARADAWLKVRGGRDQTGRRLILERVQDEEAFRVLTGCHGDAKAAVRLLASLDPAAAVETGAAVA